MDENGNDPLQIFLNKDVSPEVVAQIVKIFINAGYNVTAILIVLLI